MKATIDIPNDLYRRVKAKSALEARTIREVTVSLYRGWIEDASATIVEKPPVTHYAPPLWFAAAKIYAKRLKKHDMASIRHSISEGRKSSGDLYE